MSGITPEAREAAIEALRDGWHNGEGEADMASETGYVRFGEHGLDFIPPTRALDALIALGWAPAGVSSHPTREQIIDVIESAWTDEDPEFSGVIADRLLAAGLWTTPAGGARTINADVVLAALDQILETAEDRVMNRALRESITRNRLKKLREQIEQQSGSVPTETEGEKA